MALWLWAKGSDEVRALVLDAGVELTVDVGEVSGADLCSEDKHEALCDAAEELTEACAKAALKFLEQECAAQTVTPHADAAKLAVHLWDKDMAAAWLRSDFGLKGAVPPMDGPQLLLARASEPAFEGKQDQLTDALALQALSFCDAMASELPERKKQEADKFACDDELDVRATARRSKDAGGSRSKESGGGGARASKDADGFGDSDSSDDE